MRSVLVVDDDKDARRIVRLLLEETCEVLEASNGPEGLRILRERPVSMVLLDMQMPGMDGLDVVSALRRTNKSVRVVMLTGDNDLDAAKRALELGADAYLTKPYDAAYLKEEVQSGLGLTPALQEGRPPWRLAAASAVS